MQIAAMDGSESEPALLSKNAGSEPQWSAKTERSCAHMQGWSLPPLYYLTDQAWSKLVGTVLCGAVI